VQSTPERARKLQVAVGARLVHRTQPVRVEPERQRIARRRDQARFDHQRMRQLLTAQRTGHTKCQSQQGPDRSFQMLNKPHRPATRREWYG